MSTDERGRWSITPSQARSAARAKVAMDKRRGRQTDPRVRDLAEGRTPSSRAS